FPLVGEGGRTALAGPVYHFNDFEKSDAQIPQYYDGKLIIYEWMRHQIFAVTMDGNGDYAYMERFAPNVEFSRPTDMIIGPGGVLYLLEYGTNWNVRNPDARLVRIEFDSSL
ncbi:MAG: PKD domain-containing protein, partial [Bacteroidetes bacterium]|nr:PKD domain-containing protein [Bacteroidota bacterium]